MSLRENIWKDTVACLDLRAPLSVPPDMPLRQAIAAMRQAGTGCVLVCDNLTLRGIFTERDLLKRVMATGASFERPVSEFMTAGPSTVKQTDTVGWAIRRMVEGHYRHFPVVDERGEPTGILSAKAIVRYMVDHVPLSVYNLPPRPGQVEKEREGA